MTRSNTIVLAWSVLNTLIMMESSPTVISVFMDSVVYLSRVSAHVFRMLNDVEMSTRKNVLKKAFHFNY